MFEKKYIVSLLVLFASATGIFAQPLAGVMGQDREAVVARIDSNTLKLRNKLYPIKSAGDLNTYGFNQEDIPVYSDSTYAFRLSLLETEIPLEYNEQVRAYIDLYANRKRKLVSKVLATSKFYFPIFEEVFDRENVPMELKYLAVIESALNQKAISPVGAAGLWQFMAPTGRMYGLRTDTYIDDRKDIIKSTEAAVKYFQNSYRIYGDWLLVIASYNCGPGNVSKAIRRSGGKRNIWEIMPYLPRETRGYVPAFIAAAYVMNYASEHNLYPSENEDINFHLDTIMVDNRTSIEKLALSLNVSAEEILKYNPSIKRGVIPFNSNGVSLTLPYHLAVKLASIRMDSNFNNQVDHNLIALNKEIQKSTSTNKVVYQVKSGDYLGKIAKKYNVTVADIKKWNKGTIKGNTVYKGQKLKVYPNRG
ncbi:MAG: transglycosylase SLT domain-containing protein [Bacteroidia bacterium]|nr:transglycosylase SLT domain-containing protein [Bacteroidia bacterium]MCF8446992.1 transglycosylase SLT domain-containing protein [Bacteroidia bacterium]